MVALLIEWPCQQLLVKLLKPKAMGPPKMKEATTEKPPSYRTDESSDERSSNGGESFVLEEKKAAYANEAFVVNETTRI